MAVPSAQDFEKLGVFYLGREYELETQRRQDGLVLYDSRDLVTHAVCVGMTGSGKTGLCVDLLEEAAIDGVPAIVIDPKGDLSNLLLTFPELKPSDFRPWINEEDALKKGVSPDEYGAQQAAMWAKGLADWGQDGARIKRLRDAAVFTVYTPGSNAGLPVSVLKSFDAPSEALIEDTELFRERVSGTVSSLLGLVGVESDAMTGREHILLSSIFSEAWAKGRSLDLAALITQVQSPPMARVGVMELESFFPSKDRFGLAMAINNLVASPGFSRWTEGESLDIGAMLRASSGKPRISIYSIAHLNDAERMFFVSLLLNQMLGWTRSQSGSSSLRALLYMDEIAGYFPPTANPPSKGPLLTLMKQGRAFGVGVVLATQNPVDLDYKGLSNAGTWFIGRLQTERDKARVLDGLEGAAANAKGGFDRASIDRMLSRLGSRVFLMNNVHEDGPVVFETRWAMSYLRGPLTREQLKRLKVEEESRERVVDGESPARQKSVESVPVRRAAAAVASARPVLPPDVPEYFISTRSTGPVMYTPMLLGCGKIYYSDVKARVEHEQTVSLMAAIARGPVSVDWERAKASELSDADLEHEPAEGASYAPLPTDAGKARSYEAWKKGFVDALFRTGTLELLRNSTMKETSKPGESVREFKARLAQLANEQRDEKVDKLRAKYAPKLAMLEDRMRRAEQAVQVQKEQSSSAKFGSALSVGSAILGTFFGRKAISTANIGRAATAARGMSRSMKESSDVGRAEENVGALREQYEHLDAELRTEIDALALKSEALTEILERVVLRPKKTNISVRAVVLVWAAEV